MEEHGLLEDDRHFAQRDLVVCVPTLIEYFGGCLCDVNPGKGGIVIGP